MRRIINKIVTITTLLVVIVFTGCDVLDFKEPGETYDGDVKVKFNSSEAILFAEEDQDMQTIGVSTLKPISQDRTYSFTVVDDTVSVVDGDTLDVAEAGVHYTLDSNSFTIPANEVLGEIPITLIKANLADAPILHLRIASDDAAAYNSVVALRLRQFTPYNQADFIGTFDLVYPWWFGDANPREVTTIAGSDENTIIVVNMLGTGTDIEFTLDDSDKANFTVTFDKQGAWTSGTYGSVRMAGSGTFDAASLVIEANAEHTVSAGTFGTYPFTMTKK